MKIDLFLTPPEIPLHYTKGRRVVIVDVLGAGTSFGHAFASGVDQIIPVESAIAAKQLVSTLDRENTLLVGEQDGARLNGFDLGGAPGELEGAELSGKTLIWALPHDPIFTRSFEAVEKIALAFLNMEAVVRYLDARREAELTVVCAGEDGRFALEDAVAAGMLLELLGTRETDPMNDGARAAWILYLAYRRDLGTAIRDSIAGQTRLQHGQKDDLHAATQVDALPLVPVGRDGRFTLG